MTDFKTWFEQKYIDWLSKRGKRGSIREFSEMIGVDQKMVANWMRGDRKPGPEYADKIAIFLNFDLTIYELLGMPVPDRRLLELKAMYPMMTDEDISDLDEFLDRMRKRHEAKEGRNISETGNGHSNGSLAHAGRLS